VIRFHGFQFKPNPGECQVQTALISGPRRQLPERFRKEYGGIADHGTSILTEWTSLNQIHDGQNHLEFHPTPFAWFGQSAPWVKLFSNQESLNR
jgi:hypothetical protein